MADITEVIHKITYETDDSSLQNVTRVLQQQVNELNSLGKILQSYQKQLAAINSAEVDALERLSGKIEQVSKKVEVKAAQTKGTLQKIGAGIINSFGGTDMEQVANKFMQPMIDRLGQVKAITAKSVGDIVGSLFSISNVAPLVISGLAMIADELLNDEAAAKKYAEALDSAGDEGRKIGENAANEMSNLILLRARIEDVTLDYNKRKEAVDELQKQYPSYFANLREEEILAGRVGNAYESVVSNILTRARLDVMNEGLKTSVANLEGIKKQIALLKGSRVNDDDLPMAASIFGHLPKYDVNAAMDINHGLPTALKEALDQYNTAVDGINGATGGIIELEKQLKIPKRSQGRIFTAATPPKEKATPVTVKKQYIKEDIGQLPLYGAGAVTSPEFEQVDTDGIRREYEQQKENEKNVAEQRRENIKQGIADYQALAQSVADAYNRIVQVQVDALDKEIAIREKRVEAAQKLAERGNVEALRLEEERLREAQNMREQFARRQQAVNAAITVSNAIAAVARAALEGGGFGSVATIAALIAALAAGYAAVGSMSNDNAFADGVVGFRGRGGPRDDNNQVWISNGESVITAEGTRNNRHILEAINSGAQLKMINPALAYTMPVFKSPEINSNAYASRQDLGNVEAKLDSVVSAIEDNRLRQNIYFNEQGVGIMTERAIKKDRRKWM